MLATHTRWTEAPRTRPDSARFHELAYAVQPSLLDQVERDRYVGEEVAPRVRLVRADSAHFRGEVDDERGLHVAVQADDVRLVREVVVVAAGDEDVRGRTSAQAFGHGAAEEAGAAG